MPNPRIWKKEGYEEEKEEGKWLKRGKSFFSIFLKFGSRISFEARGGKVPKILPSPHISTYNLVSCYLLWQDFREVNKDSKEEDQQGEEHCGECTEVVHHFYVITKFVLQANLYIWKGMFGKTRIFLYSNFCLRFVLFLISKIIFFFLFYLRKINLTFVILNVFFGYDFRAFEYKNKR